MAFVGAADPTNPALVLIAAFVAKNVQNGNRAAQEYLLKHARELLAAKLGVRDEDLDGCPMFADYGRLDDEDVRDGDTITCVNKKSRVVGNRRRHSFRPHKCPTQL